MANKALGCYQETCDEGRAAPMEALDRDELDAAQREDASLGLSKANWNGPARYKWLDWEDLPEEVREAYKALRYVQEVWDEDERAPTEDLDWDELSNTQQETATILGYTATSRYAKRGTRSKDVSSGTTNTTTVETTFHSCVCEAKDFGFKINCANTAAMLHTLVFLEANKYADKYKDAALCHVNYLVVQATTTTVQRQISRRKSRMSSAPRVRSATPSRWRHPPVQRPTAMAVASVKPATP